MKDKIKTSNFAKKRIMSKIESFLEKNTDFPIFNERNIIATFGTLKADMCSASGEQLEEVLKAGETLFKTAVAFSQLHVQDEYVDNIFTALADIMVSDCYDANQNKLQDPVAIREQRLGKIINYTGDKVNHALLSGQSGVGGYLSMLEITLALTLACRRILDAKMGPNFVKLMAMSLDHFLDSEECPYETMQSDVATMLEEANKTVEITGTVH